MVLNSTPVGSAPAWFAAATAAPAERASIAVDGVPVVYRTWGEPAEQGIVLVHGGAAHSHWWDHIAPLLTQGRRVVALDLSGHGDSGRRDRYDLDLWAREVLTVAGAAGLRAPTVVGHSMGGYVTLRLATLWGDQLAGAVVIDSAVRDMTPEERAAREHRAFGPLRVYPSRESALERFRTIPEQPVLPYIAAHVAETSLREVDGGWSWKFDPHIFVRPHLTPAGLTKVGCRLALFRAEHGILSAEMSESMYDRLGRAAPVIEIPAAGHHVMLDQPIALVTGIRTLLSDWDHSVPGHQ